MANSALDTVRLRMARAAEQAGRSAGDVTLIAVSKTFEPEAISPVLKAGQKDFGENRVQEAMGKWPDLKARHGGVKLHLIGPLQTNKASQAVALSDAIHTLDRPKLAAALAKEMARQGRSPELFVQVNTGDEAQKAGITVASVHAFLASCRNEHGLNVTGLMCIPPVAEDPKPHFKLLAELAARHGLTRLSMGMSADFEAAIACGATHVRVGSALFGQR